MGKLLHTENATEQAAVIGKRVAETKGNHRFRLVNFESKYYSPIKSVKSTKCTLSVYKAGLILSGDFCENCKHISVLSNEISRIELVRGRETIDTFYLSPLHILSKIGLPNSVARHFRFHPTEYRITQTKIRIEAKEQFVELITSGYRFEKLKRSFKKMGYGTKLNLERKPCIDQSEFKDIIT